MSTDTAAQPLDKAGLEAALDALGEHGMAISAPWQCDLDDFERERFDAISAAISAYLNLILSALEGVKAGREFWLHYDGQVGRWCVEREPPKVVRPGAEIIHMREV